MDTKMEHSCSNVSGSLGCERCLKEITAERDALTERVPILLAQLDQARADAREVENAVGAEFKKLNAKIESLEAQHRGYDDLKAAILSNLRDTSMRAKVWTVTELHKAELNVRRLTREIDDIQVDVNRCREISDRDGRDYSELHNKHTATAAALEKATAELEAILAAQERCGDPDAECPLQDSHKPGSTKDIAAECRALLNAEPKKEVIGG